MNLQKISEAVAREFAARRQKSEHRRKYSCAGQAVRKNLDEAGYSRLLIEISLLDAACNAYSRNGAERIEAVAKR